MFHLNGIKWRLFLHNEYFFTFCSVTCSPTCLFPLFSLTLGDFLPLFPLNTLWHTQTEELVKALQDLENAASGDAAVRQKIASLPQEVQDVSLLEKITGKTRELYCIFCCRIFAHHWNIFQPLISLLYFKLPLIAFLFFQNFCIIVGVSS